MEGKLRYHFADSKKVVDEGWETAFIIEGEYTHLRNIDIA